MKLAALAFIVILVLAIVYGIDWYKRRQRRNAPWSLDEIPQMGKVCFVLSKPGEQPEIFRSVAFSEPEFDDKLHLARSESEYHLSVLNEPYNRKGLNR